MTFNWFSSGYAVEQEHVGFRLLAGYGLSVSRAAAAGMSFTFSLLLLTMCRNSITVLRETILNHYIPFDSYVAFHKLVAYTALFFCGESSFISPRFSRCVHGPVL